MNGTIPNLLDNCPGGLCYLASEVSFSCEPGYYLPGNEISTCRGYDRWDPPILTCEGKPELQSLSNS